MTPTTDLRPATFPGRAPATLAALASVLVAAFIVVPPRLAAMLSGEDFAGERPLADAARAAFVEYWRTGDGDRPASLRTVVDYWFNYHMAKAVIAALLLVVLVALGGLLWKAFLRAGGGGTRAALASAGALVATLTLVSLATVLANVQGVAAPFASLLPMVTNGPADAGLAETLEQVRQRLASDGEAPPALDAMVDDFARYHAVMAVSAAIVALVLIGVSVAAWRRLARTERRDRPARLVVGSFAVLSTVVSLLVIVVAAANTATATDPAPALQAFFDGSW